MLDRREVLQRIAILLGGAVSASTLAGCRARQPADAGARVGEASEPWQPQVLTGEKSELVATLVELIIPRTDTPGARDAGVHEFVDLMLAEWMKADERDRFLAGLEDVELRAAERHGAPFVGCSTAEQTAILQDLEDEAIELRAAAEEEAERPKAAGEEPAVPPGDEEPLPFFSHLKELTLVGFYTSEIGATQELQRVLVHREYEGCVPLAEVGAAWS